MCDGFAHIAVATEKFMGEEAILPNKTNNTFWLFMVKFLPFLICELLAKVLPPTFAEESLILCESMQGLNTWIQMIDHN
jgi:hypothetical protein